jgi:hypothetical protein
MAIGYVYVMSNRKMPGLLKVGFTCSSVERRRRELSSATGVPDEFTVDYFQLTEEAEETEGKIHAELAPHRVADRREFFAAKLAAVFEAINRHVREPPLKYERPMPSEPAPQVSGMRFCSRCGARYARTVPKTLCPKCGF